MIKKKSSTKHISHTKTHILLKKSLAVYALLVFVLFFTTALAGYAVYSSMITRSDNIRLDRIQKVYSDLNLDDSYRIAKSDVFGDKRPYSWGTGRTFSSSMEYGHNDTQTNTFADLKKHIEAIGFKEIKRPNYGDLARQDHYKGPHGEFIRVQVLPKAWRDSMVYGVPTTEELSRSDITAAPVYVTIKVNLDDNNE